MDFITKLKMNLQFFSQDDTGGSAPPDDQSDQNNNQDDKSSDDDNQGKDDKNNDKTITLTQTQLDRMMADRERRALKDKEAAVEEAKKLAKMNADQKREYEIEKLQRENEELKASQNKFELGKTATAILAESGITADDQILDFVVMEDAEKTNEAVKAFTDLVDKISDDKMKDKLRGNAPKKQNGQQTSMSKDDIMKIQDTTKRQQLIAENIHLFR